MRRLAALTLAVCLWLQAACVVFAENDAYTLRAVYSEDAQALTAELCVEYTNTTGEALDYVMFCVYSNCFRRESTLPYDNSTLTQAFPYGYVPSGTEFTAVTFNEAPARYAFHGEDECFLRVDCSLAPGETGFFGFVYTLLMSENRAFQGCGEDIRPGLFYPVVCPYDSGFQMNPTSRAAQWCFSVPADYRITLQLPEGYEPAGMKITSRLPNNTYLLEADGVCAPSLTASLRWHEYSAGCLRAFGSSRSDAKKVLAYANTVLACYEEWFGPLDQNVDLVLGDCAVTNVYPGLIVLGSDAEDDLYYAVARGMAKQFFGRTDPATDPFLTDGVCEYLALLTTEQRQGTSAFVSALRQRLEPALKLTVPGGLTPDMHLSLFTNRSDYETVVARRGAAVLYELQLSWGKDVIMEGLRAFRAAGSKSHAPGIEDFVAALDAAAGASTGESLIAWLYTIDEYVNISGNIY